MQNVKTKMQSQNNFLLIHRHVLSQLRQRTVEPGEEEDKKTENKSNHIKQASLFGFVFMAGALMA